MVQHSGNQGRNDLFVGRKAELEREHSLDPLILRVFAEVKEKISRIVLPKRHSCWPILIHVNGISDSL